jgi:hypothetical protein
MKQQSALIAIPEEWILLLSGVQRRVARLSTDLHVARRLALRRITRIRADRWYGRDGACVGECGEAQSGTAEDASGSDGGRNEADEVTRHGCVHFEFSFASWMLGFACRCFAAYHDYSAAVPWFQSAERPVRMMKCVSAD